MARVSAVRQAIAPTILLTLLLAAPLEARGPPAGVQAGSDNAVCKRLGKGRSRSRQLCLDYYKSDDGSARFWTASVWQREEPAAYLCSGIEAQCLQRDIEAPKPRSSFCTPPAEGAVCGQGPSAGTCRAGSCTGASGQLSIASLQLPSQPAHVDTLLAAGEEAVSIASVADDGSSDQFYSVTLNTTPRKKVVLPANYLGVSMEWGRLDDYASNIGAWADIFRNLGPSPVLRIGGASQETLLSPDKYSRIQPQLDALAALRDAVGSMQFVIGLPLFYANSPANISQVADIMARAQATLGPSVIGYELGNEPNYWPLVVNSPSKLGGWDLDTGAWKEGFVAYVDFFNAVAGQLPVGPCGSGGWRAKALMGPGWGGNPNSINDKSEAVLLSSSSCNLKQYTLHHYPLYDYSSFTMRKLMSEDLMRAAVASLARPVAAAAAAGVRLRISESNSMYNAGRAGVSDRFGAALWTADWAFESARAGVASLQLHWGFGGHPSVGGPPYAGVQTNYVKDARGVVVRSVPSVHAPWWGYLLFGRTAYPAAAGVATAAARTGTVYFAGVVPGSASGSPACLGGEAGGLKVWPLMMPGRAKEVRVAVINKGDPEAEGGGVVCNVTIKLTGAGYGDAQLMRLASPAGHSGLNSSAISFGGQSYAWLASRLAPEAAVSESLPVVALAAAGPRPQARVAYSFMLPPASAAILWVSL